MKLGTETGSVTNWMMSASNGAPIPEVGKVIRFASSWGEVKLDNIWAL